MSHHFSSPQTQHHQQPPPMKAGFKTGRRQHRSCDQCRKGKRACDVAFAKEPGKTEPPTHTHLERRWLITCSPAGGNPDNITALGPCSNCKRTGKNCTLQWLRAVHRASLRPRPDFSTSTPKLEDTPQPQPPANPPITPAAQPSTQPPGPRTASDQHAAYSYPYSPPVDDQVLASLLPPQNHHHAHSSEQWPTSAYDCLPMRSAVDPLDEDFSFDDIQHQDLQQHPDYQPAFFSAAPSTSSSGQSSSGMYMPGAAWECDETEESPESIEQGVEDVLTDAAQTDIMPWRNGIAQSRARSPSAASFNSFLEHLQPSHVQSRLSSTMNQSVLTKGLWKVYHDSFENALSCWLTEKTCPYTYQMLPAPGDNCESLSEVWGPSWVRPCRLEIFERH